MKKTLISFIILVIAATSIYLLVKDSKNDRNEDTQYQKFSNNEIGLEFDYPTGDDGYVLSEVPSKDTKNELVTAIVLTSTEDSIQEPPEGGEGPAVISISVYKNSKKEWPQTWADSNPKYSLINLKIGEVYETVVGGANAIGYMADGLYASGNVVVAHGENVYVFSAQFMDEDSEIINDFNKILASIQFVPTGSEVGVPQGKLDVRVVCEQALIYMTFPSSVEADAFVAECVDGKHPQVIESYIKQMGLDGAAL